MSVPKLKKIKRILLLIPDISTLGGVQIRTAKTLRHATSRDVAYECLTLRNQGRGDHLDEVHSRVMVYEDTPDRILATLRSWDPIDTVVIFPNNTLRGIDKELRAVLDRFPLVYVGSGQLAYHLQDSKILRDRPYCEKLRVTKVVLLSELDKLTYNQFGCYGQIVGFNPVEPRPTNSYSLEKNQYFGYVGRIDFFARGAERLIDIAKALREIDRGPLKIFTVSNPKNSPQFAEFQSLLTEQGCRDDIDMELDVTDLDRLFADIGVLILPSKKESFGNTILEAYSYGIPVISSTYAPGPSTLIEHDRTGLLIERYDIDSLVATFAGLSDERRLVMSARAFEKHKSYAMDHYFDHIERVAEDALRDFDGENRVNVYPELRLLESLHTKRPDKRPNKRPNKRRKRPLKRGIKKLRRAFSACQRMLHLS